MEKNLPGACYGFGLIVFIQPPRHCLEIGCAWFESAAMIGGIPVTIVSGQHALWSLGVLHGIIG